MTNEIKIFLVKVKNYLKMSNIRRSPTEKQINYYYNNNFSVNDVVKEFHNQDDLDRSARFKG